MAKKKNQHYLPQFYIRHFSIENNQKEIGIYNLKQDLYIYKGSIKHQCSENYFYGEDEIVENFLAKIEGNFAKTFKSIIEFKKIDKKNKDELFQLLAFITITDLRSLTAIENLKTFPLRVNALDNNINFPPITHKQSIMTMFTVITDILPTLIDLDYKLFINKTDTQFIMSDYPIAKYNYLYENLPTYFSVTGYQSKGFMMFLPISPILTLVFFDKTSYKIGTKKSINIEINDSKEIDQLNILQILNANKNIFFNEKIGKEYIINQHNRSKKFNKPNIPQTFTAKFERSNGVIDDNVLFVNQQNDTFINLKLKSLKIHSGSKYKTIDVTRVNLRE